MTTDKTGTPTTVKAETDRFTIGVEGQTVGFAEFTDRDGQRVFTHTEVDGEFEGRGPGHDPRRGGAGTDAVRRQAHRAGVRTRRELPREARRVRRHRRPRRPLTEGAADEVAHTVRVSAALVEFYADFDTYQSWTGARVCGTRRRCATCPAAWGRSDAVTARPDTGPCCHSAACRASRACGDPSSVTARAPPAPRSGCASSGRRTASCRRCRARYTAPTR